MCVCMFACVCMYMCMHMSECLCVCVRAYVLALHSAILNSMIKTTPQK